MKLLLAIALWYTSSAVCNSTGKQLLQQIELPYVLSTAQFLCSFVLSSLYRIYLRRKKPVPSDSTKGFDTDEQQQWVRLAAISFTLGFTFVNTGVHVMHVSINETLRAGEPVFSVFLATIVLKETRVSRCRSLTLVPIVSGIALSSYSNANFRFVGFLLMVAANFAFSFRSIFVKRLRIKYNMEAVDIMHYSLKYGSMLQVSGMRQTKIRI